MKLFIIIIMLKVVKIELATKTLNSILVSAILRIHAVCPVSAPSVSNPSASQAHQDRAGNERFGTLVD
jgi:hypothetical protein